MPPYSILTLLTIITSTLIAFITSDCIENYKTICDNLEDIKHFRTDTWGELLIGDLKLHTHLPDQRDRAPFEQGRALNDKFLNHFANLNSLTIINQINVVWLDRQYRGLDYLNLYKNNLDRISMHSIANLIDLRTLILKDNNIKEFAYIKFASASIRVLDVSRNNLEIITGNFFANSNLTKINMRSNKLSIIGYKPFPKTLKILNLDFNDISNINEDTLENLKELEELTLSNNKIRFMPQLKHLKSLRLLDLSRNDISTLFINFATLANLNYLDFSSNNISKVADDDVRDNLYTNIKISLAFNRLSGLSYHAITSLFSQTITLSNNNTISLYGNPLYCDCLSQMRYYFKMHVINTTKCDEMFFNSGETPTCLVEEGNCDRENLSVSDQDYDSFIAGVVKNEKNVKCNLVDDFYKDRIEVIPRRSLYD